MLQIITEGVLPKIRLKCEKIVTSLNFVNLDCIFKIVQEFNYLKASQVLAHAKLFTKSAACSFYGVPSGTYDRWKNKLKTDQKLLNLYNSALIKLQEEWQGETVRALKKGLEVMYIAFENHPFDKKPVTSVEQRNWGYNVDSAGKAIKSIGDLAIGTKVLMEDDDDDEFDGNQ